MRNQKEQNGFFLTEEAITSLDGDLFDFKSYARKIQKLIQNNSSNPAPLTIGIYGKWGSGKTSFLNLIEKEIDIFSKDPDQKGIIKYHFNPWRYSSEDELLFDFFDGLAKALQYNGNSKREKIGKGIIKLSLKENFDEFIILFAPYYNNEFCGAFWVEQYDLIKSLLSINYLIGKVKEYYNSIYFSVEKSKLTFGRYDHSSLKDFIYQLSYWHLNEIDNKNNEPLDSSSFAL